jgi:dihydrofolate synthase/folylpolyglutamate synthase
MMWKIMQLEDAPEISFLYGLTYEGRRDNLDIMHELLMHLNNPHLSGMKYVHVTGTNGKGSVCSAVYSVLRRRYRAGLYVSPHVYKFNERIVVNDKQIEDEYIINFIRGFMPIIERLRKESKGPSFFEVVTSLAFEYFARLGCEVAVIEVGLGGRLDPTNVINPLVSAITSIDLEHTQILGNTIESIAYEKAGIIKPGVPVVVGALDIRALRVIKEVARNRGAELYNAPLEYDVSDINLRLNGMSFRVLGRNGEYKINFPLVGRHQVNNVLIALKILELLKDNFPVEKNDIELGLAETRLPGRFEVKLKKPLVIFDIAHNPAAARALADTIGELGLEDVTFLFSALRDKDLDGILSNLSRVSTDIIVTEIGYEERKTPLEEIERCARKYFKNVKAIRDSKEALQYALEKSDTIIATGSAYLLRELEIHLRSIISPRG